MSSNGRSWKQGADLNEWGFFWGFGNGKIGLGGGNERITRGSLGSRMHVMRDERFFVWKTTRFYLNAGLQRSCGSDVRELHHSNAHHSCRADSIKGGIVTTKKAYLL